MLFFIRTTSFIGGTGDYPYPQRLPLFLPGSLLEGYSYYGRLGTYLNLQGEDNRGVSDE